METSSQPTSSQPTSEFEISSHSTSNSQTKSSQPTSSHSTSSSQTTSSQTTSLTNSNETNSNEKNSNETTTKTWTSSEEVQSSSDKTNFTINTNINTTQHSSSEEVPSSSDKTNFTINTNINTTQHSKTNVSSLDEEEEVELTCVIPPYDPFTYDKGYIHDLKKKGCPKSPTIAKIDHKTHIITVDCKNPNITTFYYGFGAKKFDEKSLNKETNPGFINSSQAEVVSVSCDKGKTFQYFAKVSKKDEAYNKALSFIQNKLEKKDAADAKLLNIVVLGVDSASRAQWYRKLKNATRLLQSKDLKYKAYDFESFHVMGDGTLKAVVPFLTGAFGYCG